MLLRALTLTLGATYPAMGTVLAVFMCGLGLGAWLGGRVADGGSPVRAYVVIELGVAASSALFHFLPELLGSAALPGLGPLPGRALLAGLALLPCTAAMGATFPLLARALHRGGVHAGHIPRLYAANTLGAFAGCFLGGLVLPFALGLQGSLLAGAALNLGAAALAWRAAEPPPSQPEPASRPAPFLLALSAGSGFLALACELLWTRSMLQLDRYAYSGWLAGPEDLVTLVLSLLLLGNAVGAAWSMRYRDRPLRDSARLLTWTLAGVGVSSLLCLEWFAVAGLGLHRADWLAWPPWTGPVRLLPVLPPALLLGVSFPLVARLYGGGARGHGARIGLVWLVNAAGAVLGSVGAGVVLLPTLGCGWALVLCSGVALALAALAAWQAGRGALLPVGLGALALGLVAALVPLGPGQWYAMRFGSDAVLAAWESWDATTVVVRNEQGLLMGTNGRILHHREALDRAHRIHELARSRGRVLVVGLGTGVWPTSLLTGDAVERMVIVEIDPWQFRAAPWFGAEDELADARVEAVVDDALHYIDGTAERFDLVLVDAWGPEASPGIYSAEFHARALAHLSEEGLVYAKLSQLTADSLPPVQDAVRCTYPFAYAVRGRGQGAPFALLGGRQPLLRDPSLTRLPPADEGCDPLTHWWPRRLRVRLPPRR